MNDVLLDSYLKKNKLFIPYLVLNQSLITILDRKTLFTEKAQQFRNFTLIYQSSQQNATYDMVKLQLILLDLLSNIFMSLEDYLVYSYHLRNSLRDFHKKIASRNKQVAENETKYLNGIMKKDIDSYLLLPKPSDFQLQLEENDLVRSYLNNIVTVMYNKIRNILKFYNRYYRVYIKYKHILPSILGSYSKIYDSKSRRNAIYGYIYIRDNLDKKGKNKFNTYIIQATGLDVLNYFEDIADDIGTVFGFLVLSRINQISNLGNPFLLPHNDYINHENKDQWDKVLKKVNRHTVISPNMNQSIKIEGSLLTEINKNLEKYHIHKLRRDIFDPI